MPTCIVCLNTLKDPAALPCGHVFCHDCIIRLIHSITPYTNNHFCPTCKQPYTISNVDPNLVPHHLRPFITPSVRKLFLEYTIPVPSKGSASNTECGRLLAENASLKTCCFVWRKRAAVHAAATLGLVGLARLARDYGLRMKKERDELEEKYNQLKQQMETQSNSTTSDSPPETPSCPPSPRDAEMRSSSSAIPTLPHICELNLEPLEVNIPPSITRMSDHRPLSPSLYRLPSPAMSDESYCSDCPDCVDTRKRKRDLEETDDDDGSEEPERPIKRSHSSSPTILAPLPLSPERAIANYLEGSLTI